MIRGWSRSKTREEIDKGDERCDRGWRGRRQDAGKIGRADSVEELVEEGSVERRARSKGGVDQVGAEGSSMMRKA